jgi:hypothetical protein
MVQGIGRNRLGSDLTSIIDALGGDYDESGIRGDQGVQVDHPAVLVNVAVAH